MINIYEMKQNDELQNGVGLHLLFQQWDNCRDALPHKTVANANLLARNRMQREIFLLTDEMTGLCRIREILTSSYKFLRLPTDNCNHLSVSIVEKLL